MSHICRVSCIVVLVFAETPFGVYMSDIVCSDCGSKKLMIWFNSKKDYRDLCDKCFLIDGKVKK